MHLNYPALAIPFFCGADDPGIFIAREKRKKNFNFTNSIAYINVVIAKRLPDTLITGLVFLCTAIRTDTLEYSGSCRSFYPGGLEKNPGYLILLVRQAIN